MEESRSNTSVSGGKRRIVATGVGGIAGIMILGGALAVATMIKNKAAKRIPDKREGNQDIPASPTQKLKTGSCSEPGSSTATTTSREGGEGLRSLLDASSAILNSTECIEEQAPSRITPNKTCLEPETTENPIKDDESIIKATGEDIVNDKISFEEDTSVITPTRIEENDHVQETIETPIKEDISATEVIADEKVSNCPDLLKDKTNIENESSRVTSTKDEDCYEEPEIVGTPREEDISTIEIITEENISTSEDLSSCNSIEDSALNVNLTQINGYHTEPEPVETQTKEDIPTNGIIIEELGKLSCEDTVSCNSNTKQDAPTTISTEIGDNYSQPDTVETPIKEDGSSMKVFIEENLSKCEESFSCNNSTEYEASKTVMPPVDDNYPEPEMVETPAKDERPEFVEENDSISEELLSCKSNIEHDASTTTSTEVDNCYHEIEMVENHPIMEEKSAFHNTVIQDTVEKEFSHEEVKTEPENLEAESTWESGAIDMIKDGSSVSAAKVSVDIDEGSVICCCVKEETENEDNMLFKDPSTPLKGETENKDDEDDEMEDGDSEDTRDSSIESNSEAIWPVESPEEELLLSKDRAKVQILEESLYKETRKSVEEAEFVTTGMELKSRPSKIFSRGGLIVWLLLVVGLMFVLFTSDLPISYHLTDPQLSSS